MRGTSRFLPNVKRIFIGFVFATLSLIGFYLEYLGLFYLHWKLAVFNLSCYEKGYNHNYCLKYQNYFIKPQIIVNATDIILNISYYKRE